MVNVKEIVNGLKRTAKAISKYAIAPITMDWETLAEPLLEIMRMQVRFPERNILQTAASLLSNLTVSESERIKRALGD